MAAIPPSGLEAPISGASWVNSQLAPVVGVFSSRDAEALCRTNNMSVVEMLRAFSRIGRKLEVTDMTGQRRPIAEMHVRFLSGSELEAAAATFGHEVFNTPSRLAQLSASMALASGTAASDPTTDLQQQYPGPGPDASCLDTGAGVGPPSTGTDADRPARADSVSKYIRGSSITDCAPWFGAFADQFAGRVPPNEFDYLSHPVVYLCVLASHEPNPLEKARAIFRSASTTGSNMFDLTNIRAFYVVLHDASRDVLPASTPGHVAASSPQQGLLDSLRSSLGQNVRVLTLNSQTPALDPLTRPLADWPWYRLTRRRPPALAPATAPGATGSSSAGTSDPSAGVAPGLAADDPLGAGLAQFPARASAPGSPQHDPQSYAGAQLADGDVQAMRQFVEDFVESVILPKMESSCHQWNVQVANQRRGFTGRLFSVGRRYFSSGPGGGGSSGGSGSTGGGASAGTSGVPGTGALINHSSPEALLRRLADFSLQLQDFKFAQEIYSILKREFGPGRTPGHAGSLHEALGVCLFHEEKFDQAAAAFSTALAAYMTPDRGRLPVLALRAALVTVALSRGRLRWRDIQQALQAVAGDAIDHVQPGPASPLDALTGARLPGNIPSPLPGPDITPADSLRAGLLQEQLALTLLFGRPDARAAHSRRYALHMALAAERFARAQQTGHAVRLVAGVLRLSALDGPNAGAIGVASAAGWTGVEAWARQRLQGLLSPEHAPLDLLHLAAVGASAVSLLRHVASSGTPVAPPAGSTPPDPGLLFALISAWKHATKTLDAAGGRPALPGPAGGAVPPGAPSIERLFPAGEQALPLSHLLHWRPGRKEIGVLVHFPLVCPREGIHTLVSRATVGGLAMAALPPAADAQDDIQQLTGKEAQLKGELRLATEFAGRLRQELGLGGTPSFYDWERLAVSAGIVPAATGGALRQLGAAAASGRVPASRVSMADRTQLVAALTGSRPILTRLPTEQQQQQQQQQQPLKSEAGPGASSPGDGSASEPAGWWAGIEPNALRSVAAFPDRLRSHGGLAVSYASGDPVSIVIRMGNPLLVPLLMYHMQLELELVAPGPEPGSLTTCTVMSATRHSFVCVEAQRELSLAFLLPDAALAQPGAVLTATALHFLFAGVVPCVRPLGRVYGSAVDLGSGATLASRVHQLPSGRVARSGSVPSSPATGPLSAAIGEARARVLSAVATGAAATGAAIDTRQVEAAAAAASAIDDCVRLVTGPARGLLRLDWREDGRHEEPEPGADGPPVTVSLLSSQTKRTTLTLTNIGTVPVWGPVRVAVSHSGFLVVEPPSAGRCGAEACGAEAGIECSSSDDDDEDGEATGLVVRAPVAADAGASSACRFVVADNNIRDRSVMEFHLAREAALAPGASMPVTVFVRGERSGQHRLRALVAHQTSPGGVASAAGPASADGPSWLAARAELHIDVQPVSQVSTTLLHPAGANRRPIVCLEAEHLAPSGGPGGGAGGRAGQHLVLEQIFCLSTGWSLRPMDPANVADRRAIRAAGGVLPAGTPASEPGMRLAPGEAFVRFFELVPAPAVEQLSLPAGPGGQPVQVTRPLSAPPGPGGTWSATSFEWDQAVGLYAMLRADRTGAQVPALRPVALRVQALLPEAEPGWSALDTSQLVRCRSVAMHARLTSTYKASSGIFSAAAWQTAQSAGRAMPTLSAAAVSPYDSVRGTSSWAPPGSGEAFAASDVWERQEVPDAQVPSADWWRVVGGRGGAAPGHGPAPGAGSSGSDVPLAAACMAAAPATATGAVASSSTGSLACSSSSSSGLRPGGGPGGVSNAAYSARCPFGLFDSTTVDLCVRWRLEPMGAAANAGAVAPARGMHMVTAVAVTSPSARAAGFQDPPLLPATYLLHSPRPPGPVPQYFPLPGRACGCGCGRATRSRRLARLDLAGAGTEHSATVAVEQLRLDLTRLGALPAELQQLARGGGSSHLSTGSASALALGADETLQQAVLGKALLDSTRLEREAMALELGLVAATTPAAPGAGRVGGEALRIPAGGSVLRAALTLAQGPSGGDLASMRGPTCAATGRQLWLVPCTLSVRNVSAHRCFDYCIDVRNPDTMAGSSGAGDPLGAVLCIGLTRTAGSLTPGRELRLAGQLVMALPGPADAGVRLTAGALRLPHFDVYFRPNLPHRLEPLVRLDELAPPAPHQFLATASPGQPAAFTFSIDLAAVRLQILEMASPSGPSPVSLPVESATTAAASSSG
ncbi:hypothetical protein H696_03306 [Fonticula alba]|uniref:Trafficking protein particle complex subunit 8 n=1 Tax=Fonticula alba TaxID=691883 RepID=A0A058Z7C6_FONAL|nr:hypothetical protein H696_03306 [Fonticula alba]KCV69833.1 hypothetical protein H696_03306 [Fonticula alba]|eukprot:XP_009495439.1 hypothetical protein H696_03306 [Fonticula alba]